MGADQLCLCLFGAPLDTGNRGVEALARSVLAAIARDAAGSSVTLFDNGWGVRPGDDTDALQVALCGVRRSRRVYRRESWLNVRLSQRLGGAGNPVAARLLSCDGVLDISGGDSFSDVYGPTRLRTVLEPKLAALRTGRPLVLLPQTYGPFRTRRTRAVAADVLRRAEVALARDDDSYQVLLDLLGADADPERHRRGVDVAFGLEPRRPTSDRQEPLLDFLMRQRDRPLVGLNVSGLLWQTGDTRLPLDADYAQLCRKLVVGLVADGADVMLVPHVRDVAHHAEDDLAAGLDLISLLPDDVLQHVTTAPDDLAADEVKWVIGRLDWFCGARMHATIAALSGCVPTAAVAYSMKTRGVFATCGIAGEVVDARTTGTDQAVDLLRDAFARRNDVRRVLERSVPDVVTTSRQQLSTVLRRLADPPERQPRCIS